MVRVNALTINEAAEQTGYNPEYLRRLAREGEIDARKLGQQWLLSPESVAAYAERMRRDVDGRAGPKT